ncbi:MAG TPA: hypothetical protein VIH89_00825 [Candidatus Sulfotelmatobacter sp.]
MRNLGTTALRGAAWRSAAWIATAVIFLNTLSLAQNPPAPASKNAGEETTSAVRELQEQVRQLKTLVDEMRTESTQSRTEMQELRHELQDTRSMLERAGNGSAAAATTAQAPLLSSSPEQMAGASPTIGPSSSNLEDRVQKLEDSASLLGSKIDEQYQTKVETASKYRARLSGIVLFNMFQNRGNSNNLDLPDYAETTIPGAPSTSLGATLRQSEIGLEIFGPDIAGAKTSAGVQFDFAGGFPATGNGADFGIARLQTASLRLDWAHTSVVGGQDALFISPLSPTSFASLATPAFGFAGNLWAWTPQLRVEHRFDLSDSQTLTVQAGLLDNLDWEPPYNPFYRTVQAGEQSGQPAYALRTAWSRPFLDHPLSFGMAGYYSRQNWNWGRNVDAWAGMADWQVPLARRLTLSGEFYRGRGIGGLGAAIGTSILYGGDPTLASSPIRGLDAVGGWSQLKYQLTSKVEFNAVFAEDNAFAGDVRGFAIDQNNFGPILGRNRGGLGNVVYRPRSDLLFSAEFRRLRTFPVYDESSVVNQINLAMGILF